MWRFRENWQLSRTWCKLFHNQQRKDCTRQGTAKSCRGEHRDGSPMYDCKFSHTNKNLLGNPLTTFTKIVIIAAWWIVKFCG